ncbi:MAG: hypothetical protein NTX15_05865 [Candidatus Kapabacteria bacterium]|nr:hypothetical protein [Candidatus Kapabacteria bacterium]
MNRIVSALFVVFCAMFLTACGTYTSLIGTWTKPDYINKRYKKVLVFATGTKTLVNQSVVERAVATRLAAGGTMAVPASDVFPRSTYDANGDGKIDDPSIAGKLAAKLKEQGYDAVLVFGLKDLKEQERYVPGTVTYTPSPNYGYGYNNGWSNYWANSYQTVETPGYYTTDVEAYVEANMFDIASGELVWSGQTETLNPVAISDASESFANVIAPAIMKSGLVLVK